MIVRGTYTPLAGSPQPGFDKQRFLSEAKPDETLAVLCLTCRGRKLPAPCTSCAGEGTLDDPYTYREDVPARAATRTLHVCPPCAGCQHTGRAWREETPAQAAQAVDYAFYPILITMTVAGPRYTGFVQPRDQPRPLHRSVRGPFAWVLIPASGYVF